MGYISAQQAATKWGISKRRVQVLCTENRIKNATRIGNMWVVPEDALKPADGRVQTHRAAEAPTARVARTALKKLTANAYQEINTQLNNPSTSKMLFISLLATTIFCDIQNTESSKDRRDVFVMISSELFEGEYDESNRKSLYEMFSYMLPDFDKYIYRYSDYVDDVLSWAYQYVNKLSMDSGLESTQFFTEEYMIEYLTKDITKTATSASVYLDPACGGGNFLSHILSQLYSLSFRVFDDPIACIENIMNALCGYELDPYLAAVASVNLKLKALMLLAKVQQVRTVDWKLFCPNIFTSVEPNSFGFLEVDFATHKIRRLADRKQDNLLNLANNATEIYTNPPFQTVKGMANSMKGHLKKYFPIAKCDLCNAFILQCIDKIQTGGTIGLVTQSSWMYLDSFEILRRKVVCSNKIESIADLGSGAFYDLSGEKANVALVRLSKTPRANTQVKVVTLRDLPLKEKAAILGKNPSSEMIVCQTQLFGGEHIAFSLNQTKQEAMQAISGKYGDLGVPMQGTSTGNAAKLIGYYWEHINDPEWIPVSKGGSYSRWCGLNSYVLKWGTDGEYIRATKGSVLRNTKYFNRTSLVYSDTGTSGFNARLLQEGQLFVASGPGIRDIEGSPYSHLALLNSRIFSYFLKAISPKLTVAAGYISRVPVPTGLLDRTELDSLGRECYNRKREHLKVRPNNLEWSAPLVEADSLDAYACQLFVKEMQDELAKLRCEKELDDIILEAYALDRADISKLDETVGVPVVEITGTPVANELDKAMAQALDVNCQIIRTRANKRSLGCDGMLEFIARKEQVNPSLLVELLSLHPESFVACRAMYKDLVIHSIVLAILGFRLKDHDSVHILELRKNFLDMYPRLKQDWGTVEAWISLQFNLIHTQAFYEHPYYHYEDGIISRSI